MPYLWATDVHLDHAAPPAREAFLDALRRTPGEAVILTGDVAVAGTLVAELEAIADAAARPVHHVLGNHDHYGSSVGAVRDAVTALAERRPAIQWLPPAGVVTLADGTALIGVDGWADGRFGEPLTTPLAMNDDRRIAELAAQDSRVAKLAVKRALAEADARRLQTLLERAAAAADRIVVATHVPPFPEALPPTGRLANPDWLPILICGATGHVLRRFAAAHRNHRLTVLCGHTHVEWQGTIAPNLVVNVGGARYGEPTLQQTRAQ